MCHVALIVSIVRSAGACSRHLVRVLFPPLQCVPIDSPSSAHYVSMELVLSARRKCFECGTRVASIHIACVTGCRDRALPSVLNGGDHILRFNYPC